MDFITQIIASPEFAALIVTVVVGFGGWVSKNLVGVLKANLTAEQLAQLAIIAKHAVLVAEQTGVGATGEEKKLVALQEAQKVLDSFGIKVDATSVEAAIEAAVYSELTAAKPAPIEVVVPASESAAV